MSTSTREEETRRLCQALVDIVPYIRRVLVADSCIDSTRLGISVLTLLGVKAEPQPCAVRVFNQAAVQTSGLPSLLQPLFRDALGAWEIQIGATGLRAPGRWDGHLVIHAAPFLVDLTLDQASRPEKGILLQPGFFRLREPPRPGVKHPLDASWGGVVEYEARADLPPFEDLPGWRRDWGPFAAQVAERMGYLLAAYPPPAHPSLVHPALDVPLRPVRETRLHPTLRAPFGLDE